MKKRLFSLACLSFAIISLLGSLSPAKSEASVSSLTETTVIDRYSVPNLKKERIASLPLMHRASLSPSTAYLYTEKIGRTATDPTTYYLYERKTKKLAPLSGYAAWYPKSDKLLINEKGNLVSFDPVGQQKKLIAPGDAIRPIVTQAVSPNELYLAYIQIDRTNSNLYKNGKLILQDLATSKILGADTIAMMVEPDRFATRIRWQPNGRKLFYQTSTGIKEWDLATGHISVHTRKELPSYSADMTYAYDRTEKGAVLTHLPTGRKLPLGSAPGQLEGDLLSGVHWAPVGHAFVGEEFRGGSNGMDAYVWLRYQHEGSKRNVPPMTIEDPGIYYKAHDNKPFIGWSPDAKWIYTADLASIHCSSFVNKCNEQFELIEP
ncbi:hypothetical protein [Brevibacillus migulae]|uniref:hypothetical protein n=1 Tax=Brevibacillus migulae TaxID=1644114 RepID=UPI00106DE773|nr:hypothetical protein [Brevibacillus migulae]